LIATRRKPFIARAVDVVAMLPAIDFDDQMRFEARKVDDVRTDRNLTSKPVRFDLLVPYAMPECALRIRHVTAKIAGVTVRHGRGLLRQLVLATPPTLTLPLKGGGNNFVK